MDGKTGEFFAFLFFRSGDAEGFIEPSQLFKAARNVRFVDGGASNTSMSPNVRTTKRRNMR